MKISIKRVYEEPAAADGTRVLVDRLWPRGLTKEKAKVDLWLKEIAPSTGLRKWFGHDASKWGDFKRRYREELKENTDQVARLEAEMKRGPITLLYAAKDVEHNEAVVLMELLKH